MNKTYLAFYTYTYRNDHPNHKNQKNKEFQYVKVVQAEDERQANRKALTYLSDKAENEKLIIAHVRIEETEILR